MVHPGLHDVRVKFAKHGAQSPECGDGAQSAPHAKRAHGDPCVDESLAHRSGSRQGDDHVAELPAPLRRSDEPLQHVLGAAIFKADDDMRDQGCSRRPQRGSRFLIRHHLEAELSSLVAWILKWVARKGSARTRDRSTLNHDAGGFELGSMRNGRIDRTRRRGSSR